MSNNELISVIVPVYKVEEYLKKCVDSIINQTYSNLEIILVDDNIVLFDLLSHVVVSEISSISYQNNSNNYKWLYTCLRYML